uniref:myeloid cell nuclear differentiation antigen n=1 Tax=Jaculus jaculus TaxID=51337 RepID=UPI001E1B3D69|nr:myeloid cell nuclear differentiation antigen [Jaculus jaculus]
MVNEYKKIVLLKGLENISNHQFRLLKCLLAPDLKLTRKMQEEYDKIKIADLMEDTFPSDAGLRKMIELYQDIPELEELAEVLKKEMLKVKGKTPKEKKKQEYGCATPTSTTSNTFPHKEVETPTAQKRKNTNKEKTEPKKKKLSEGQAPPPCSEGVTSMCQGPHFQISSLAPSSASQDEKTQAHPQQFPRNNVLRKEPTTVMVLKATNIFDYNLSQQGMKKMFHATVATESQYFQVKVFDINLKEKFTKDKVITISNYIMYKGILEINEASSVSEDYSHQEIKVPNSVKQRASLTPKIDQLYKASSGTMVYGLFMFKKKKVHHKNTIYEIQDNTGSMEVVGNGKWHNFNCENRNKVRLFCFQLRTINKTLKLVSTKHSLIMVTKSGKNKKEKANVDSSLEIEAKTP